MKRQSVLVGALVLALGGIIAKLVGALYKIPLTNILGSNGMGLYYLVFPLYSLLLVLISSGTSIAVSRLVSTERINNNKHNELMIFKTSLIFVFALSVIFTCVLIAFSENIAILQGNANAKVGYIAIAPSIICASLISVIRGYFQGQENMVPTLLNNIAEQAVKLVSGLILANYFMRKGVIFAVFGAILGVTISEFFAFIFIMINYVSYKRKVVYKIETPKTPNLTYAQTFKKIVSYAYPATLSAIVIPITTFLDSFLIINILTKSGFSSLQATNLYGISNGIVSALINLPVLLCGALATAIVPNLSGLYAQNNEKEVIFKTSFFIKITWIISLFFFIVFLIFAPDIISILYQKGLTDIVIDEYTFAYKLLMISSVSIIYYAFLQTFTSILQSINRPIVPFISLIISLIVREISIFLFVSNPKLNIFGVAISNLIFLSMATLINLKYIKLYVQLNYSFTKLIVSPIASAIVAGVSMYFLKILLSGLNVFVYTLISGGVGTLIYFALIFAFRSFNYAELKYFRRKKIVNAKYVKNW